MEKREIAKERIERLFELADEVYDECPEYAHRYVERARKIGMRNRVRIPRELKRRYCSNCHSYLVFGDNARVRTSKGYVVVTCEECGDHARYPYSSGDE